MKSTAAIIVMACVAAASAATLRAGNSAKPGSAQLQSGLKSGGCTSSSDFDYLMHVQQWPPTVCQDEFTCSVTPVNDFTMHGFWPNNYDGSYPCNCDSTPFELSDVSDLLNTMYNFWPSYKCSYHDSTCDGSFWDHEWSKHGTCAGDAGLSTVHDYFGTTLALRNQSNVIGALSDAGIKPDDNQEYSTTTLRNAISNAVGATVEVQCDSSRLLEVVVVCYDKTLKPMNCPTSDQQCSEDSIYLPATSGRR